MFSKVSLMDFLHYTPDFKSLLLVSIDYLLKAIENKVFLQALLEL